MLINGKVNIEMSVTESERAMLAVFRKRSAQFSLGKKGWTPLILSSIDKTNEHKTKQNSERERKNDEENVEIKATFVSSSIYETKAQKEALNMHTNAPIAFKLAEMLFEP